MDDPLFTGVGVALLTFFDGSGRVDLDTTADHARRLVDAGVRAVVVAGSTGEAAALDAAERVALLSAVGDAVEGRVPLLAGTGAETTPQAAAFTADAVANGADGVLVLSPPGTAECRHYYDEVVVAASGSPVLAYHWPAMSPPGIPTEVLRTLPVDGLKDSTGDPERLLDTLDAFPHPVYTGSAALLLEAGALGCAGAILSLANIDPQLCTRAFDGDAEAQRALGPLVRESRMDFPRGLKAMAARTWGTPVYARLGAS